MVFSLRVRSLALPHLVAGTLFVTAPAAAQSADDRATARLLVEDADKKLEAQDWQAALDLLARALALVPAPTIKLAMARAMVELNQLVEAQQLLLDLGREPAGKNEPPQWTQARHTASKEATALKPRLAALTITVEGPAPGATSVQIDGKPLRAELLGAPRVVNPGTHVVQATAAGFRPQEQSVNVTEGERQSLALRLEALGSGATSSSLAGAGPFVATGASASQPPTSPDSSGTSSRTPLMIGAFAAAGAFAVLGGVTGLMSKSKVDDVKSKCDADHCPPSSESDADAAKTLGWISTASFGVAALGLGVGIWALVTNKPVTSARSAPTIELRVGVQFASVRGQF